MENNINQFPFIKWQNKSRKYLILLGLLLFSLLLQSCPFAATSNDVDCEKYGYQGRVAVNYFAYYNGSQWEDIPLPGITVNYDFMQTRTVFADSVHHLFYFYHDYYGDYSSPRNLWAYSLETRQWKLMISASFMRYFTMKDGILYFYSTDSLFTTEKGIVRGSGIMKFDGNQLTQLDTVIRLDLMKQTNMFIAGDYVYIQQLNTNRSDELWRYSLSNKQYEKAPISIFFPWADYNLDMNYIGVGRYIYYNYVNYISGESNHASGIFRYDELSGTSTEVVASTNGLPRNWIANEYYIYFNNATIKYKGKSYSGSLLYDINKDEFITFKAGFGNNEYQNYLIKGCLLANQSVFIVGEFNYINDTPVGNIARYDVQERKIQSLDGGVYRTDAGCTPVSIQGIASMRDKLLIYGNFQSAGIR